MVKVRGPLSTNHGEIAVDWALAGHGIILRSEWDVAAGQCIVEQAGGRVVDEHGQPLRYNQRDIVTVHNFLAYGDADRPWLEALDGIALYD